MAVSSEEDVANLALLRLGEPEISTLTSTAAGRNVEILDQLYDQNRDYCLVLADWKCSTRREHLTRSGKTTITAITAAEPPVVTISGHAYAVNDMVVLENVGGMTEVNSGTFVVGAIATNTITLQTTRLVNVNGTGYGAFTTGGEAYRFATNDWQYVYDEPTDSLKTLDLLDEYWGHIDEYLWIQEKGFIYTDVAYAALRFTEKITNPSTYDDELVEVMAARLAWQAARRVHDDDQFVREAYLDYLRLEARARGLSSVSRKEVPAVERPWEEVR